MRERFSGDQEISEGREPSPGEAVKLSQEMLKREKLILDAKLRVTGLMFPMSAAAVTVGSLFTAFSFWMDKISAQELSVIAPLAAAGGLATGIIGFIKRQAENEKKMLDKRQAEDQAKSAKS